MKVPYKSRLLEVIQRMKRDNNYFAHKDVHDGLQAMQTSIESMKVHDETPRGTIDGTNRAFRVNNPVSFIVMNGVILTSGVDYTFNSGVITFKVAPPALAVIRSHYL